MSINPKEYLLNLPSLQQFQCMVCFQVQVDMMRCSGPCKGNICLICASAYSQGRQNPSCPKKCSSPLRIEPIPGFNPQFNCPFAAKKCQGIQMSLEQFGLHGRQCQGAFLQVQQQSLRKEEYICVKGHPLLFLNTNAEIHAFNGIRKLAHCNGCGVKKYSPSFCYKCSQPEERVIFCNQCRPLPCTRDVCPIGHDLQRGQVQGTNFSCDLCGHCIILFSQFSYSDRVCNFDICQRCYQELPEYHPLVPLEESLNFMQHFTAINKLVNFNSMGVENWAGHGMEVQGSEEQEQQAEGIQHEEGNIDAQAEESDSFPQQSEQDEEQEQPPLAIYSESDQEENEPEEQEWSASQSQHSSQDQEQNQQIQIEQPIHQPHPDHYGVNHVAQDVLPNVSQEEL